jgi:unsaturated rhamnogalacturonyl hydrolase
MKKFFNFAFACVVILCNYNCKSVISSKETTSKDSHLLQNVKTATLAMQRKDWEQGSVAQAFLESGDTNTTIQIARASVIYTEPNGRLAVLGGSGLIDCAMLGEALYVTSFITHDTLLSNANEKLKKYILEGAARATDGTLYHADKQMWVDSYNCAIPYLASMGNYDEALKQAEGLRKRLWDNENKMFYHIWDDGAQKWANKVHWGVGNGWAAVGLTRLIRSLPESYGCQRKQLISELTDLIDGCLKWQTKDGLFHNIADDPSTFIESNMAHMLAYSIYTGIKGGWLAKSYMPAADKMRLAAVKNVDQYGFVQNVCGAPTFDKPGIAPEGQAFFILMESAYASLK